MKAVFARELNAYYKTMVGYVFAAFLLFFGGLYTYVYQLKNGYANFEYVLYSMVFVFLILIPILTMRSLSEERRQKTDQLLYSLPISMSDVVLGKYAAMLTVIFLPLLVLCLYPLLYRAFGSVNLKTAYSTLCGFFFLAACLTSIGLFISSLTENQAISAGICLAVMVVLYFAEDLNSFLPSTAVSSLLAFAVVVALLGVVLFLLTKNAPLSVLIALLLEALLFVCYLFFSDSFAGRFPAIFSWLSPFARFQNFVDGVFSITDLVYYASSAAVFVFLSVQSMEKRRWQS